MENNQIEQQSQQIDQWQAQWIWLSPENISEQSTEYVYAQARRTVTLEQAVTNALLAISANNIYRLYVNGKFIGRGPDRSDPNFPYYDVYNIADALHEGVNVIAVELYAITTKADRGRSWCLYGGEGALLVQCDIETADGSKQITTDGSWRIREAPCWRSDAPRITRFLGYIEHYDANLANERTDWLNAEYDDASWSSPALLGTPPDGPMGKPLAKEIPFLNPKRRTPYAVGSAGRSHKIISSDVIPLGFQPDMPMTMESVDGQATDLTLDFGRSMGGFIELQLANCTGGKLEIFYGEDTHQVLFDIIELPAEGPMHFSSFDWRGARHVTLRFLGIKDAIEITDIAFIEWEYPFENKGAFDASNPRLGDIWRRCRLTAHVGVKDHPVDCVHREQALWAADLLTHVRTAIACFGDVTPFAKACRQAVRNVTDSGVMPVPGPVGLGYHFDKETLPWSEQPLVMVLLAAEVYKYSADVEFVRDILPGLQRVMKHFEQYCDDRGLIEVNKENLQNLSPFCGWTPCLKEKGFPTIVNAEYVMALRAMMTMTKTINDMGAFEEYTAKAETAASSLREEFYDSESHLFIDGEVDGKLLYAYSPTANAYAVLAGLLPETEHGAWGRAMETDARLSPICSAFDGGTILEAYLLTGADDAAMRLIETIWGQFLDLNEPCIPERWLAGHNTLLSYGPKGSASRCHPYATAPAHCLIEHVLGIQLVEPGGSKVRIAPRELGQEIARGRLPLPQGDVEVFRRRSRNEWHLEVTLPANVVAKVELPRPAHGATTFQVNGETIWQTEGWDCYRDAILSRRSDDAKQSLEPTMLTCELSSPGRHIVRVFSEPHWKP